jgi:uncharacterized cupin superfamily protein
MLRGNMVLQSAKEEKRHEFRAPDNFFIPDGWKGTWEVREAMKKWYAISQPQTIVEERV